MPLSVRLGVLDRLDAAAASASGPLDPAAVLAAVAPLAPGADRQALEAAVADQLADRPMPAVIPVRQFAFGWRRPATAAQAAKWASPHPLAQALAEVVEDFPIGVQLLLVCAIVFAPLWPIFAWSPFALSWTSAPLELLGGLGLGIGSLVALNKGLSRQVIRPAEVAAVLIADASWEAYVASPSARAYLRAIRQSACPQILSGDVAPLNQ